MKNILLIAVLFLNIVACASAPPHRILNDRYINPKYDISIQIPKGWLKTTKSDFPTKPKIVFFNEETNGVIFLNFDSFFIDVGSLGMDYVYSFSNKQMEVAEKKMRKISKDPHIKDIRYDYFPFRMIVNRPERYFEASGLFETNNNNYNKRVKGFIYKCKGDDTCNLTAALLSSPETFPQNNLVFEKILNSISYDDSTYKKHPLYIRNDVVNPFSKFLSNLHKKDDAIETKKVPIENVSGNTVEKDIESKLVKLKDLMDKGLITQEDYDKKKDQLLNNY